jgi:uncharacterized protein with HEPN domain
MPLFNRNNRLEKKAPTDLSAFIRDLTEARIANVQNKETVVRDLRDLERFVMKDLSTSGEKDSSTSIKKDSSTSTPPLEVVVFKTKRDLEEKLKAINEKLGSYQKQFIDDVLDSRPEVPLSVCYAAERVILEEFPEAAYAGDIRKEATLRLKLLRLGALVMFSWISFLSRLSGRVEVPSFGASYAELRNKLAKTYRNLNWNRVFRKFISPLITEDDLQTLMQVLELGTKADFTEKGNKTQAVRFLSYLCRKLEALTNLSEYVEQERQEQFLELQRNLLGATRALLMVVRKNEKVEESFAQAVQVGFENLCSFNQQLLETIIRSEIIDPFVSKYCNLWSIFCYVKEDQRAFLLSLQREDQLATVKGRPIEDIKCPFSGPLAREVSKRVNVETVGSYSDQS